MIHYLRYCCAMFFALFGFQLTTPLSAQTQNREAYVSQSADKTTLTFYYDTLRATRTGTTWGIEEMKKEGYILVPAWAGTSHEVDKTTTRVVFDASFRDFRPTTTAKWFYRCEALKQIKGLEYLNTSEVKDMSRMFYGCSALTTLDLKNFNTQNVTNMSSMFAYCLALKSLDLKNFNTQNVTNMNSMFSNCWALTSLDLKNFNTQNVTDMNSMFSDCWALKSLDLKFFNTQNVTDMNWMFYACPALTTIYSNTAWRCPKSDDMFFCNPKLKGAVSYDGKNRDVMMANPETGYFTAKPTTAKRNRRSAAHLPAASKRGARKHLPAGV